MLLVVVVLICILVQGSSPVSALPTTASQDYAKALHLNFLFYEAQRSGVLPKRRLAWRDDSCLKCYGPKGEDLRGGYYEAANTMKWGLPKAFMLTQNAFGAIEFKEGFKAVQEFKEVKKMVRWGIGYLENCYSSYKDSDANLPNWEFVNKFEFVGHFGDSEIDFEMFSPPEYMDEWDRRQHVTTAEHRLTHYVTKQEPSSEITAETAAAMAAASILLKEDDPTYAARLVRMSKQLLRFAILNKGSYRDSSLKGFRLATLWYPPSGPIPYDDEIAWAAAWLYRATGEAYYLETAETYYLKGPGGWGGWNYSWDEKGPALHLLMLIIGGPSTDVYVRNAKQYFDGFLPGTRKVEHTPGGLNYIYHWGANRYASHTAFLGFVLVKLSRTNVISSADVSSAYRSKVLEYSAGQIDYLLGDNPQGYSWMVGYGSRYPLRPYHVSSYNSILHYPLRECPCVDDDLCVHDDASAPVRCTCDRPDGTRCNSVAENFNDFLYSATPNQHILYGAIVGSPVRDSSGRASDVPVDNRNDYEYTEVTQDYNAAMGGSLAFMVLEYEGQMAPQSDCGLELGWDHPNAWQRPDDYWPEDDCYHRCDCTPTLAPTRQPTVPTPEPTKQPTRYCPNGLFSSGAQNCRAWPDCCGSGTCFEKDQYWAACLESCTVGMYLGGGPWSCKELAPAATLPPTPEPTQTETAPPTDGETAPPTDGETAPPTDGETTPPTDGETTPPPSVRNDPVPAGCPTVPFLNPSRDCTLKPDCCPEGTKCLRANQYWAECRELCTGDNWECTEVTQTNHRCEYIFNSDMMDCSASPECCAAGTKCYRKNQWWAACKPQCEKGYIDNSAYPTPWECEEISQGFPFKLSVAADAPWNLEARNRKGSSLESVGVWVTSSVVGCALAGVALFAFRKRQKTAENVPLTGLELSSFSLKSKNTEQDTATTSADDGDQSETPDLNSSPVQTQGSGSSPRCSVDDL